MEDAQTVDWQKLILWQDEALVVINKPAGLLSLPDGFDPSLPHLRAVLEPVLGRLWVVHRLDRDTSGVILLARSAATHRALNQQFEQHQAKKIYHAIVCGKPEWETCTVDLPLRASVGRRKRTAVDHEAGKPALTLLALLERFGASGQADYSLVEARPQTGRTHQIRAHLAALEHPIAADPLYGSRQDLELSPIRRTALHAWQLQVLHPQSGEVRSWQAAYPDDFQAALLFLRQMANPAAGA